MPDKQEKKRKNEYKRSFTFADLIVLIVVVGVIGVLGSFAVRSFVEKASTTNATTELRQAQEIILSELVSAKSSDDLEIEVDGLTFEYDKATGRVIYSGELNSNDEGVTFTSELFKRFKEFSSLDGTFNLIKGSIIYTTSNGKGKAIWRSGELPKKY